VGLTACPFRLILPLRKSKKKALATAAQFTAEASTIIFNAATVHLKALKATAKEVNKEVNTQVEVEDDEQSNSKVLIKTLA